MVPLGRGKAKLGSRDPTGLGLRALYSAVHSLPKEGLQPGPHSWEVVAMTHAPSMASLRPGPPCSPRNPTEPAEPSAIGRQQAAGTKPPNSTYLPFGVPVPVLVLVSQGKLQWIMILNFLVGHFLTDALQRKRHRSHHTSRPGWGINPGRGAGRGAGLWGIFWAMEGPQPGA